MNNQMDLFTLLDINEVDEQEKLEDDKYHFSMTNHRIKISDDIKKKTSVTCSLWNEVKKLGFMFLGVVRDHTAIFEVPFAYMAIHHFVDETPAAELVAAEGILKWRDLVDESKSLGKVLSYLEGNNFKCHVPIQAWTDAWLNENMYPQMYQDWHLSSPKHKLMVWCMREDHSFLVEFFINLPIPPYGVSEMINYPSLAIKRNIKTINSKSMIESINDKSMTSRKGKQEDFEIMDQVEEEKISYAQGAIHEIMTNNNRVILAYSGGKDSHVCLLLVIDYLINHPECMTEVTILSASTLVENPIIEEHILKVKESVESLKMNLNFITVKPDIQNTFMVCVLGHSYSPPSQLNKWCVSRLKLDPADKALTEYMNSSEFFTFWGQEEVCLILGTRDAESVTRAKSIQKHFGDDFYGTHRIEGIRTAAPIRYFQAKDVVTYLVRNPAPWKDYGNFNLINLYGSAMGGFEECPIGAMLSSESEAISSCTGSGAPRMGCYSCTVIKDDQSLINMAKDYYYLENYLSIRKILKKCQDIRYGTNTGYQRKRGLGQFGSGLGDLTIDIRTIILEHMRKLNIPLLEEEVYTIYRIVREREITEGIPVTKRFRDALFNMRERDYSNTDDKVALIAERYDVIGTMYSSIWDPWNSGVDSIGQEDIDAINRILKSRTT